MPGVEYGLNVAFVASSPETENEKPQHQSPLTTRFAGDTRAAEIQSLEAWDHHSRHMSARPQAKPRSALSAAVSVSGAPPAELVAPKATRSAAGLLGANEPAAISFSQSHPEVAQLSTGAASGSGTGTGTSKSYRRLAFQPPSSSSTSPGPLSGSPARGASASPSFQLSSSYLARGSFQPGFIPPSSFQSSSGLSFARRRPSVYRFYRAPRAGEPALVVFSGGSGFNSAAEEMGKRLTTRVTHVLPVSDDGGSTAEIVRVLGGPAVGDIRSRCLRLSDDSTDEGQAVKALLGHRLHPSNATEAKHEWADIVEGTHPLWKGIGAPYRDTIRAFLLHFNYEILREPSTLFNFCNGSVGNFFFAGARTFFKSMDAAIFLYGRVSHIPPQSLVTPAVATSDRLTLGAELLDGTVIRGQNAISHPSLPPATSPASSHPSGRAYNDASNLVVDKESQVRLSSRIKRVFYVSPDQPVTQGSQILEIYPHVHSAVPGNIYEADGIIYAMGSFYTSICPSLVLKGVGEAVARRRCRKILILNGGLDRETSKMTKASDYVRALVDHLNRAYAADPAMRLDNPPSSYVNCLFVPRGGEAIEVDEAELKRMGIRKIVEVEASKPPDALVFTKDEAKTRIVSSSSSTLDLAAIPPENKEHQLLYDTADLIRMLKKVLANARKSSDSFMSTNGIAGGGSSTSLASLAHATMASIPLPEDPMSDDSDEEWVSDHEVG